MGRLFAEILVASVEVDVEGRPEFAGGVEGDDPVVEPVVFQDIDGRVSPFDEVVEHVVDLVHVYPKICEPLNHGPVLDVYSIQRRIIVRLLLDGCDDVAENFDLSVIVAVRCLEGGLLIRGKTSELVLHTCLLQADQVKT